MWIAKDGSTTGKDYTVNIVNWLILKSFIGDIH